MHYVISFNKCRLNPLVSGRVVRGIETAPWLRGWAPIEHIDTLVLEGACIIEKIGGSWGWLSIGWIIE